MSFDREKFVISRRQLLSLKQNNEQVRQSAEQRSCAGVDFPVLGFLAGIIAAGITGAAGLDNARRRVVLGTGGLVAGFVVGTIFENELFKNQPRTSRFC